MARNPMVFKALVDFVRRNKKITIWKAAKIVGMSPHYFRYNILPMLLEDYEDLSYNPKTKELIAVPLQEAPS